MKGATFVRFLVMLFLPPLLLTVSCRPVADLSREELSRIPPSVRAQEGTAPFDDLDLPSLEKAVAASIRYYRGRGAEEKHCLRGRCHSAAEMISGLERFLKIMKSELSAAAKERAVREEFDIVATDEDIVYTGYYEPILNGSLQRTSRCRYPLYRVPEETVVVRLDRFEGAWGQDRLIGRLEKGEVVPHYSRRQIDSQGILAGRGLEIAWVDDPVDLFSLHIQGSGKIRLDDGRQVAVSYAQSNGRPFRGLTGMMTARGLLTEGEGSYERMKKVLRERPAERQELMNYNERYIFFRVVPEGPLGALGLTLVPGRSVATDLDIYPKGALAIIETRKPAFADDGRIVSWQPFSRLVLNHDTGAAIKGPGRVDIFCGIGPEAERTAGAMKEKGRMFFILKRRDRQGRIPSGFDSPGSFCYTAAAGGGKGHGGKTSSHRAVPEE
ncbi:MAG: MltA domain-containing protein [Pseudomonadota bacterium]|nr:MltA domain-containing protein [Pseudomonadota bacterium]